MTALIPEEQTMDLRRTNPRNARSRPTALALGALLALTLVSLTTTATADDVVLPIVEVGPGNGGIPTNDCGVIFPAGAVTVAYRGCDEYAEYLVGWTFFLVWDEAVDECNFVYSHDRIPDPCPLNQVSPPWPIVCLSCPRA